MQTHEECVTGSNPNILLNTQRGELSPTVYLYMKTKGAGFWSKFYHINCVVNLACRKFFKNIGTGWMNLIGTKKCNTL